MDAHMDVYLDLRHLFGYPYGHPHGHWTLDIHIVVHVDIWSCKWTCTHGHPYGCPYGRPYGFPYGSPYGCPYGCPYRVPHGRQTNVPIGTFCPGPKLVAGPGPGPSGSRPWSMGPPSVFGQGLARGLSVQCPGKADQDMSDFESNLRIEPTHGYIIGFLWIPMCLFVECWFLFSFRFVF